MKRAARRPLPEMPQVRATPAQRAAFSAGRKFELARAAAESPGKSAGLPKSILRSQMAKQSFLAGRMFEAAKTTRVNQKRWSLSQTLMDADKAITPDLVTLRNRSRFEFYNNGYARGMAKSYSADLLGRDGPTLKVTAEAATDKAAAEFAAALQGGWYDWSEVCDATGQQEFPDFFRSRVEELWHAGEFPIQMITDTKARTPVQMRLLAIEPDRLTTPYKYAGDINVTDGVKRGANGQPEEYYVLKRHPGALLAGVATLDWDMVAARDMVHVYVKERAGQTRGYPWLASTLELWSQMRDYVSDTLLAARVAALFSGFIYTDHQTLELDDLAGELPIFDMEPGSLTTLPMGWKFAQSTPQHPSTNFREFKHEMLAEAGRPEGIPYLKIAADASGHNYSSARFDDRGYWSALASVGGWLGRVLLNRLLRQVAAELRLSGNLPKVYSWYPTWVWPAARHVDPAKEGEGVRIRLATQTTTWDGECMAQGLDPDEVLVANARTVKRCKELGLPDPFAAAAKIPPAVLPPDEPAGQPGRPGQPGQPGSKPAQPEGAANE